MVQGLFQAGLCIGLCDTVLVNTAHGHAAPLPEANLAGLERMRLRDVPAAV